MVKRLIALALLCVVPFLLKAQTTHSVALAWDASSSSSSTNPGSYSVYREIANSDGSCGASYTRIATGIATLAFTDITVAGGVTYCYTVTFVYTISGQPVASESDLSSPPLVVTIPGNVATKPSSPANLRLVKVA